MCIKSTHASTAIVLPRMRSVPCVRKLTDVAAVPADGSMDQRPMQGKRTLRVSGFSSLLY
ncbi:uncharacterized protein EKO05_0011409 [Ascochyta rabiei]|uniref:uncharacterized protein n=1 Tax=Didymella rabiei TaxID=5454 RepID=UPI0021FADF70|nr:uncharacterized protein EKO05_0011409 [Ascochyta rabiei]UPX21215.1 hypothetical protein EKO05_0011409 [Ascochyta rabiei]